MDEQKKDQIITIPIHSEIENSYLVYSLSVIIGRAIPDVRDGLKPVHRRILYSMVEQGISWEKGTKKCARIVGDVLGKYHPHGDAAIYETLVRLAQEFSMRYPLIFGQGNFGSIDGDTPAAMRYTEAKLEKITSEMLRDLDKETVKFRKNFDESLEEPEVLPANFPNLLVNGSEGIAVGMATAIPPHNLTEVINALIHLIDNVDCSIEDLMQFIKAPDFPTAGIIIETDDIKQMYTTGKGRVLVRAKIGIEEQKEGKHIIVTEIPYQENKSLIIKRIAELVRDGVIDEITNLRDESDQKGIRIVIKLKKNKREETVIAKLYKYTNLQKYYNANFIAIHNTEAKFYNLKEMLFDYYTFKRQVLVNRYNYMLRKAKDKIHILEGLLIALRAIDEVIALIKGSKDVASARQGLMDTFTLSKVQADAILEMRLQKLTSLEVAKLENDYRETMEEIGRIEHILSTDETIKAEVKKELTDFMNKFGDGRRTQIASGKDAENTDIGVIKEDTVIIITKNGYIKRVSPDKFKLHNRGSKGQRGMNLAEEDTVKFVLHAKTTDNILFITSHGRSYQALANDLPDAEFYNHGEHISQFVNIEEGEYINSINVVNDFAENMYMVFITKQGIFKKMQLSLIKNRKTSGIICIKLNEGDIVVQSLIISENDEVVISTAHGQIARFAIKDINDIGRNSMGVRGVRLGEGDYVVNMTQFDKEKLILIVTDKGYAKLVPPDQVPRTNRGVKGVLCISNKDKAGNILTLTNAEKDSELILITKRGKTFKILSADLHIQKRNTMGVRILRLEKDDLLQDIAVIRPEDDIDDDAATPGLFTGSDKQIDEIPNSDDEPADE